MTGQQKGIQHATLKEQLEMGTMAMDGRCQRVKEEARQRVRRREMAFACESGQGSGAWRSGCRWDWLMRFSITALFRFAPVKKSTSTSDGLGQYEPARGATVATMTKTRRRLQRKNGLEAKGEEQGARGRSGRGLGGGKELIAPSPRKPPRSAVHRSICTMLASVLVDHR